MSLYDDLGGAAALDAALDHFYGKVMADDRMSSFFDPAQLPSLKKKQVAFLTMAFGGPNEYEGRDMRTAHARPRRQGMDDEVFEAFMGHFRSTLEELGVDQDRVTQVMDIAYSAKPDVLGR